MKPGSLVKWSRYGSAAVLVVLLEEQVKNHLWTALFLDGQVFQVSPDECEVINEAR